MQTKAVCVFLSLLFHFKNYLIQSASQKWMYSNSWNFIDPQFLDEPVIYRPALWGYNKNEAALLFCRNISP